MPRKFRSKRKRRVRRRRHKRNGDPFAVANSVRKSPMPTKFKTDLLYSQEFTLNPGASGIRAGQIMRCNGMFDPDRTGTGHQPRGFDQLILMYDHFVVIAAAIKVTFMSVTASQNARCLVQVNDDDALLASFNDYVESGSATIKMLATTSRPTAIIMSKINPNKFLGRPHPLSDPELKGSAGSDPTEQCFWHLVVGGVAGVDTGAINLQVQVKYTAVFIEPVTPSQS